MLQRTLSASTMTGQRHRLVIAQPWQRDADPPDLGDGKLFASDQSQTLKAGMPVLADDDVVVDCDAKRLCRLHDRPGHVDVGA